MNKLGIFAVAAQFAPRVFQVRRRTWVAVGAGLLVLFGLLIWAGLALLGWLFGQAQGWMGNAPEAVRGAVEQVEQVVPGAREKLGEWLPAFKPAPPRREVSGTDLGPVTRYPEMSRTYWQREGGRGVVEFEGEADFAAVLDHYGKGFAAKSYTKRVQTATPTAETHEYTKGAERIVLTTEQGAKGVVKVRIDAPLHE